MYPDFSHMSLFNKPIVSSFQQSKLLHGLDVFSTFNPGSKLELCPPWICNECPGQSLDFIKSEVFT
jgi:hypothetical protein